MPPSATGATGSTQPEKPKKGQTKDVLPAGEFELATLGLKAADAWDASPLPALLWCSKTQLRAAAVAFRAGVGTADAADDDLSPAAQRLAELDKQADTSLKFVKNYLTEQHGSRKKGEAYYETFGLVREGGDWGLPRARPARAKALDKLASALKESDYDQSKYGTAFWRKVEQEYAPLAATSSTTRGDSARAAGTKNAQEDKLRPMLRALRQHIKTNFPDTYRAEWRGFGFLKESY
ncbi:hypothetical protein ACFST9_16875 [Hymenobacter monticola]|uniref:Uncharacterized protein n=1 Tax=Hymenobacter monticola TaxID=1705399 RepID=A0ABY4AZU0_9BACT|nr:hypothetical protein [Hymenobacter monticola]UOE32418.1 hypothetical protein MTP16_14905 [Hymenobacter monticola]